MVKRDAALNKGAYSAIALHDPLVKKETGW